MQSLHVVSLANTEELGQLRQAIRSDTETLLDELLTVPPDKKPGASTEVVSDAIDTLVSQPPPSGPPPSADDRDESIAISVRRLNSCSKTCPCVCHRRSRLATPSLLNHILGSLFVGYSGSPFSRGQCTMAGCRSATAGATTRVTYFFPRWFVMNAIDITILRGAFGEPSASLAIRNVRYRDHDLFKAVYLGNIGRLQEMFSSGDARPTDVDEFGHTVLTVSDMTYPFGPSFLADEDDW